MELEEMKATWETLSKKIENQEKLSKQIIEKMMEQRYKSKLNRIACSEYIGTLICFIGAAFMIVNFNRLGQITMQVFGILSIAYLFIMPIISITIIKGLKRINISSMTYSETIQDYIQKKIRFQKFQKLNGPVGCAFMVVSFPVMLSMMGKSVADLPLYVWIIICPVMIILYFIFYRWVLIHYNRVLKEAEKELSELNK